MPIGLLTEIIDRLPKNARLLGLDIGTKTIGFAVSDPAHSIATPLGTLKRIKFTQDLKYIERLVKDYEIGGFVIGLPLNMDGSEGPRCQSVRDFAAEMKKSFEKGDGVNFTPSPIEKNPWIAFHDERLSSNEAKNLIEDDFGFKLRKAKSKGIIDQLAAQNILQGALDIIRLSGY